MAREKKRGRKPGLLQKLDEPLNANRIFFKSSPARMVRHSSYLQNISTRKQQRHGSNSAGKAQNGKNQKTKNNQTKPNKKTWSWRANWHTAADCASALVPVALRTQCQSSKGNSATVCKHSYQLSTEQQKWCDSFCKVQPIL
jgi:hypothetical protein